MHEFLDAFEREQVHAKVDAVRALVDFADEDASDDGAARQRLSEIRARYDQMRWHQDGIDDVYLPREDARQQRKVNRALDEVRARILEATEPEYQAGRSH